MSDAPGSALAEAADKYDRLLSRFTATGFPSLIIAIGLDDRLLEALDRRRAPSHVLAIEPLTSARDFSITHSTGRAWIEANRLTVLVGPTYQGHADAWKLVSPAGSPPPLLIDPEMAAKFPVEIERARTIAKQLVRGARANEEARQRFAGSYLLNTLANIPIIASEGNASALADLFGNTAAVVVGAGPSLDHNLTALYEIRHRALFIAVDTAVRPLLAAGIHPHLVVSADPSDVNARHLNDLPDVRGLWLVAEGSVAPTVLPQFAGRTFVFKVSNHQPWPWLSEQGVDRGRLRTWGSVLTTAFDVALQAGCNPIVFTGADLAYTDGLQYCRNTAFEADWHPFPTNAERAAEFAQFVESRPHLLHPDVRGRVVTTTPHFLQFRDWIVEQAAAAAPTRIVNATGGGTLHGGGIEQRELTAIEFPTRDQNDDIHQRLASAWSESAGNVVAGREKVAAALANGPALPLREWESFAGAHATVGRIRDAVQDAAARIVVDCHKAQFLFRLRDSYNRRISSLKDAQDLSHGSFDVAARKATAQQTHVLLDAVQRTYNARQPDFETALQAMSAARRSMRALDVGCGVGRSMEPLVDAGLRVDGVDISERMIAFARQNPKLTGSSFFLSRGNDCGDAPDAAYDLAYSLLCFRSLPSRSIREDLLRAMARALRPGGVAVVEMGYWKNLSRDAIPSPHVPWSADAYDSALDAGQVDVCPTPDELTLVYDDFARHFEDVRLQFVEVPRIDRDRLPLQLFVSGSAGGGMASRIHALSPPLEERRP